MFWSKMKGNWIKKLIKLLNESEDWFVSKFVDYDDKDWVFILNSWQSFHYSFILSREYWFVQWLIKNNKIDWSKFGCMINNKMHYYPKTIFIKLLSIQGNPVKYLISYLK